MTVVKLVTQHLSAETLAGEELDPWAETSPQLLSELMGRKWSEVRTSVLEQVRESGGDMSGREKAVRKLPSPVMASKIKRGVQRIRSHLLEAITEQVKGPLYARGRSQMEVAADLLKEAAFMRRDHNDVG